MAQKALSLKILFRRNDVFADVINGLLFEGRSEGKISVYYEETKMSPQQIADKMQEPLDKVMEVIRTLKN